MGGFCAHFDSKEAFFEETFRRLAEQVWTELLEDPTRGSIRPGGPVRLPLRLPRVLAREPITAASDCTELSITVSATPKASPQDSRCRRPALRILP